MFRSCSKVDGRATSLAVSESRPGMHIYVKLEMWHRVVWLLWRSAVASAVLGGDQLKCGFDRMTRYADIELV